MSMNILKKLLKFINWLHFKIHKMEVLGKQNKTLNIYCSGPSVCTVSDAETNNQMQCL